MSEEKSTEEKEVARYKAFLGRAEKNVREARRSIEHFTAVEKGEAAAATAALDRAITVMGDLEAKFAEEPSIDAWALSDVYQTLVKARIKLETTMIRSKKSTESNAKRWEKEVDRLHREHPDGRVPEDDFPF